MASLFSGLNTARNGMMGSQTGLDVTSQNISNANTPGYSRQSVNLKSVGPENTGYRLMYNVNQVGNGVDYSSVTQSRDIFLDTSYRDANSTSNFWSGQESGLSSIEDIFNEFTSASKDVAVGLSGQMTDLVQALNTYQGSPTDDSMPSTIRAAVQSVTFKVTDDYNRLIDLENQQKNDLAATINGSGSGGGINETLDQIAALNKQIAAYETSGQTANDLRDQRNLLLDNLSSNLDITVTEQKNGMVSVGLANDSTHMLVGTDNSVTKLQVNSDKDAVYWDDGNPNGTYPTATLANIGGGQVGAYLQVINGDGSGSGTYGGQGIVYFKQKLNDFAVAFDTMLNKFAAEDQDPVPTDPDSASTALVTYDKSGDPAATLDISSSWKSDDSLFSKNYTGTSISNYVGELISNLNQNGTVTLNSGTASPGPTYAGSILEFADSFTSDTASTVSHAQGMADSTSNIVSNIDLQRQSVSSVSIDEEGINIIKYQQSYNAAAKVISVIDQMLDTLINSITP